MKSYSKFQKSTDGSAINIISASITCISFSFAGIILMIMYDSIWLSVSPRREAPSIEKRYFHAKRTACETGHAVEE